MLDAETVPFVDVTAAEMLIALTDDLQAGGVTLVIAGDVGRVRDVLRRAQDDDAADRLHDDVPTAIAALQAR